MSRNSDRFSLIKGIVMISLALCLGLLVSYQLITSAGSYNGLDDVVQLFPRSAQSVLNPSPDTAADRVNRAANRYSKIHDEEGGTPSKHHKHVDPTPPSSTLDLTSTSIDSSTSQAANNISDFNTTGNNETSTMQPFNTTDNSTETNSTSLDDETTITTTNSTSLDDETTITTTILPTTTVETRPCFQQEYIISQSCDVSELLESKYGVNVTLEEVERMLFHSTVIDRLKNICKPGAWCLSDDWQLVTDDNDYLYFCGVGTCLIRAMSEDCLDDKRKLILSTLMLLCDGGNSNFTDQCFLAVRKMTHVSKVQQLQNNNKPETVCDFSPNNETCPDSCYENVKGLHCMCDICDNPVDIFKQYAEWQWFFGADDHMNMCNVTNSTSCDFLSSPIESWFNSMWKTMTDGGAKVIDDRKILSAVIVLGIASVAILGVGVWACVRKRVPFKNYARNTVEYMEVSDEEDEFDS